MSVSVMNTSLYFIVNAVILERRFWVLKNYGALYAASKMRKTRFFWIFSIVYHWFCYIESLLVLANRLVCTFLLSIW